MTGIPTPLSLKSGDMSWTGYCAETPKPENQKVPTEPEAIIETIASGFFMFALIEQCKRGSQQRNMYPRCPYLQLIIIASARSIGMESGVRPKESFLMAQKIHAGQKISDEQSKKEETDNHVRVHYDKDHSMMQNRRHAQHRIFSGITD